MWTNKFARLAAAAACVFALAESRAQAAEGHENQQTVPSHSMHQHGAMSGHGTHATPSAVMPRGHGAHDMSAGRRTIDLTVDRVRLDTGEFRKSGFGFNGASPGPVLRFKEGEAVTIRATNTMDVATSIHWHGLILPYRMDGVPTISYDGIAPGETFIYRFPILQAGTYWYHSHSRFQEPDGAYGAIVIEPKDGPRHAVDRDYVVQLTDAHPHSGDRVMRNLKMMPDYYNRQQRTLFDFFDDMGDAGLNATLAERAAWGDMRMMPSDIEDVQGYTPLINGKSPAQNWTGLFQPGERVRLRLINSSAMAFYDIRIPGLQMTVIQADGNDVAPVKVDELRIAVAETYDVIVEPTEARAYAIFAESMGRSAYGRGTLAPRTGMTADVPAPRTPPLLTMADMGMGHADMGEGGMGEGGMNHGDMDHAGMSGRMLHDTAKAAAARVQSATGGDRHGGHMDHGKSSGMAAAGDSMSQAGMTHADGDGHGMNGPPTDDHDMVAEGIDEADLDDPGMKHAGMDHAGMGHAGLPAGADPFYAPGSGLMPAAANGGRFLSYADLRAARPLFAHRPPTREIELRLTGNMERYVWSVNGVKYGAAEPIRLHYGERVRFKFVNETMMTHPMHLHGMWSIVDVGAGRLNPIKHVVSVAPGTTVYMETEVDAPGAWAFHCHLSYHAAAGMFRKVVVEGAPQSAQLGRQ